MSVETGAGMACAAHAWLEHYSPSSTARTVPLTILRRNNVTPVVTAVPSLLTSQVKEGEKLDRNALMQEALSERLKEAQEMERKLTK